MKLIKNKNTLVAVSGLAIGLVNGLLGAGGGMIAVPLLKKMGLEQKQAHSNTVAVILPITVFSAILYLWKDYVNLSNAMPYIPAGLLGAIIGTYFLKKISPKWLKKIFAGFMIYAGVRLLIK